MADSGNIPSVDAILERRWEDLRSVDPGKSVSSRPLSVIQFNMLADHLNDAFPFCHEPEISLRWGTRGPKVLAACLQSDADIICIEECDHFEDFLLPELLKVGYNGVFQLKNGADAGDGTAVFFRESLLTKRAHCPRKLIGSQNAVFLQFDYQPSPNSPARSVYLAATHLKAKSGFEEVRQQQGQILLQQLNRFMDENPPISGGKQESGVIICGDFNDEPDSLVATEFRNAHTSANVDFPSQLHSALEYHPAYSSVSPQDGKGVIFTTYKMREVGKEQRRIIDYIWFTSSSLSLQALLHMPTLDELPHRLPCPNYPSDHLAIGAKFVFA